MTRIVHDGSIDGGGIDTRKIDDGSIRGIEYRELLLRKDEVESDVAMVSRPLDMVGHLLGYGRSSLRIWSVIPYQLARKDEYC